MMNLGPIWAAATSNFALLLPLQAKAQSTIEDINTFFAAAQIVSGPDLIDCKLSGGTKTTCFSITVISEPSSYTPGPW